MPPAGNPSAIDHFAVDRGACQPSREDEDRRRDHDDKSRRRTDRHEGVGSACPGETNRPGCKATDLVDRMGGTRAEPN